MKHLPASRTSAFYWRDGYVQKIDWTDGKRAALSRIKTAKELVAGQEHELSDAPVTGSLGQPGLALRRRGEVGRRKLKGAS